MGKQTASVVLSTEKSSKAIYYTQGVYTNTDYNNQGRGNESPCLYELELQGIDCQRSHLTRIGVLYADCYFMKAYSCAF